MLEDYSSVKLEESGKIKDKLIEGIKGKLTKEELDYILVNIGQGPE